ncbi:hypothetical protein [Clostridium saccharoperbutylacetonicum]
MNYDFSYDCGIEKGFLFRKSSFSLEGNNSISILKHRLSGEFGIWQYVL